VEHPYLFLVKFCELIGFGHAAHAYPHVIYTWFVMALLIGFGIIATKSISLVPGKLQNFLEVVVSGIEEFMVDSVTGDEGRWLLPIAATIFLYIFIGNLIGLVPGFYPPTASINTPFNNLLN